MIGVTLGSYEITEKIGSGGVGDVYKAVDHLLGRNVALKFLRPGLADCAEVVQRFHAEARTLAQLIHPNIAVLYCMMREEESLAMVMEFVEGRTFGQLLDGGALPAERAVPLLLQALEGIGHAHAAGVIHRDIKPSNLMLAGNGCVKVMDFGVARCLGTVRQTRDGHMIGTAQYMSPEQVRGLESDARSDVYALGVLAYEMLTGFVPFDSESEYELCRAQVEKPPRPPRELAPSLSPELEKVILRALEKDPAHRFPSVQALREALQAAAPLGLAEAGAPDPNALDTHFLATPARVDVSVPPTRPPTPVLARRSRLRAVGMGATLGGLGLCALLLGAKIVRHAPAAPRALPVGAHASAAQPTSAQPSPAASLAPVTQAATAAPAPVTAAKTRRTRMASTPKHELRSPPSTRPAQSAAQAPASGGNGWVIRRE
ncbi:MAG TPA: serine/threonine-protein kinase [Myxococcota bacterium]|nr:serine/threonine-protein kinase [Myxococcota bacterium]